MLKTFMARLCHDRPRFADTLDTVKFVCKELWVACWDKQVDNLRTNHRVSSARSFLDMSSHGYQGVYVLQDNVFKPLIHLSSPFGPTDALRHAKTVSLSVSCLVYFTVSQYTAMPAGIIKGALQRLGMQVIVTADVTTLPTCK